MDRARQGVDYAEGGADVPWWLLAALVAAHALPALGVALVLIWGL